MRVGVEIEDDSLSCISCTVCVPAVPTWNGGVRVEERRYVERAQQHHSTQLGWRVRGRGDRRRPLPWHPVHRPPLTIPGQPRNFGETSSTNYLLVANGTDELCN